MDCTYAGDNNSKMSCVGPILHVQGECGKLDSTITMTACNRNQSSNYNLQASKSYFKFMADELTKEAEFDRTLGPDECITSVNKRVLDTCKINLFPMIALVQGNMGGKEFCKAYASRQTEILRYVEWTVSAEGGGKSERELGLMDPLEWVNPSMTEITDPVIEDAATADVPHFVKLDVPEDCHLIITALSSAVDNTDAGYVKLYSDNCPGKTIGENFKLVVVVAGSDIIPEEGINLEGMTIGTDGFLVLCSTAEATVAYGGKCDLIVGKTTPVANDGDKSIAIVLIGESVGPIIYDIYGEHC